MINIGFHSIINDRVAVFVCVRVASSSFGKRTRRYGIKGAVLLPRIAKMARYSVERLRFSLEIHVVCTEIRVMLLEFEGKAIRKVSS